MDTLLDSLNTDKREFRYATFWQRFAAAMIDGLLMSMVGYLFPKIFLSEGEFTITTSPFAAVIALIYFAGMESSSNMGTIGKIALGIKVCDEEGECITFINACGRYLAKILSALILFIGFISMAFDKRGQAWHDKLANTFVVLRD